MRDIQLLECSFEDMTKSSSHHMSLLHADIDQLRILNDNLIKSQVEEALQDLKKMEFDILRLQECLDQSQGLPEGLSEARTAEEVQAELVAKVEIYTQMVKKVEQLAQTQVSLSNLIKTIRQHAFDLEASI